MSEVPAASKSRLWLVWAILAALVAIILALQLRNHSAKDDGHGQAEAARMLFPMAMDEVWALEIFEKGVLHRFERDANGQWFFHAHGAAKSDAPAHAHQSETTQAQTIAKALEGMSRTHREREFDRANAEEYGLNAPQMFVLLYAKNTAQLLDKITVGALAPDGLSRYVSSNNYPQVVSIANYQIENLENLLKAVGATNAK